MVRVLPVRIAAHGSAIANSSAHLKASPRACCCVIHIVAFLRIPLPLLSPSISLFTLLLPLLLLLLLLLLPQPNPKHNPKPNQHHPLPLPLPKAKVDDRRKRAESALSVMQASTSLCRPPLPLPLPLPPPLLPLLAPGAPNQVKQQQGRSISPQTVARALAHVAQLELKADLSFDQAVKEASAVQSISPNTLRQRVQEFKATGTLEIRSSEHRGRGNPEHPLHVPSEPTLEAELCIRRAIHEAGLQMRHIAIKNIQSLLLDEEHIHGQCIVSQTARL